MTFVKVCGIRTLKELEIVEKYADATGVVVKASSRRSVSVEKAKEIVREAVIPVFLVSTLESVGAWIELIEKCEAEYVQIHAEVESEVVEEIRELGIFVMKAFRVPEKCLNPELVARRIVEEARTCKADMVLLDTGRGSGKLHDHRVSEIVAKKFDVVLAGGLNPKNVAKVVEFVKPFGVDVSSGVEVNGMKDEALVKEFVKQAKCARV